MLILNGRKRVDAQIKEVTEKSEKRRAEVRNSVSLVVIALLNYWQADSRNPNCAPGIPSIQRYYRSAIAGPVKSSHLIYVKRNIIELIEAHENVHVITQLSQAAMYHYHTIKVAMSERHSRSLISIVSMPNSHFSTLLHSPLSLLLPPLSSTLSLLKVIFWLFSLPSSPLWVPSVAP